MQVNLQFEDDSVDVTYFDEKYEISAKKVLEAAGFICCDKPKLSSDDEKIEKAKTTLTT